MTSIEFNIDELVVHGTSRDQARQIGAALTSELQRLIENHQIPVEGAHHRDLHITLPHWEPDARPARIGALLANAVFEAITHLSATP